MGVSQSKKNSQLVLTQIPLVTSPDKGHRPPNANKIAPAPVVTSNQIPDDVITLGGSRAIPAVTVIKTPLNVTGT